MKHIIAFQSAAESSLKLRWTECKLHLLSAMYLIPAQLSSLLD